MKEVSTKTRIKQLLRKHYMWTICFEDGTNKVFDYFTDSEGRLKLWKKKTVSGKSINLSPDDFTLVADLKISNLYNLQEDIMDSVEAFQFTYDSPGSDKRQNITIMEA